MGTLEECRAQIARELRYQSSLDLDEATYAAIRHLPLAKDLVRASRQQLVAHLDGYAKRHKELFERVCWPRPAVSLLLPDCIPVTAIPFSASGALPLAKDFVRAARHELAAHLGCVSSVTSSCVSRWREPCGQGSALTCAWLDN